jgi:hypothetical protein
MFVKVGVLLVEAGFLAVGGAAATPLYADAMKKKSSRKYQLARA